MSKKVRLVNRDVSHKSKLSCEEKRSKQLIEYDNYRREILNDKIVTTLLHTDGILNATFRKRRNRKEYSLTVYLHGLIGFDTSAANRKFFLNVFKAIGTATFELQLIHQLPVRVSTIPVLS